MPILLSIDTNPRKSLALRNGFAIRHWLLLDKCFVQPFPRGAPESTPSGRCPLLRGRSPLGGRRLAQGRRLPLHAHCDLRLPIASVGMTPKYWTDRGRGAQQMHAVAHTEPVEHRRQIQLRGGARSTPRSIIVARCPVPRTGPVTDDLHFADSLCRLPHKPPSTLSFTHCLIAGKLAHSGVRAVAPCLAK